MQLQPRQGSGSLAKGCVNILLQPFTGGRCQDVSLNKALWYNIQAEGQGSLRPVIMYRQNPFSEQNQEEAKVTETDSTFSQILFFPVTSPHCPCPFHTLVGKMAMTITIASCCISSDGSLGMSTIRASVPNVTSFCFSLESVYFISVDFRSIYNLKVESYVLFSRNFEDFMPGRQQLKLTNLSLFHAWEDAKAGLIEIIPLIHTSVIWGLYPVFSYPEFLQDSSWLGSDCSLMPVG